MTEGISNTAGSVGTPSQTASNAQEMRNEFLTLLTYQLKAQNPLKPYDNQEFAAQLAQFSQLEQLTDIRSLMEEQMNTNHMLTQTMANSALPGLLGKTAKAYSSSFNLNGEGSVSLGFNVPVNAESGIMNIKNASGVTVASIPLSRAELTTGDHSLKWGEGEPGGSYSFEVELQDANGSKYSSETFINGKINAVRFKSEGTILVINGQEVPLNNVSDISTEN